jgi:integrase
MAKSLWWMRVKKMNNSLAVTEEISSVMRLLMSGIINPHTKRGYKRALQDFESYWLARNQPKFNKLFVNEYKTYMVDLGYGPTSINQRLSAIKKLVREAVDNGMLDPVLGQGIQNVEGVRITGTRTGNWLTLKEAQEMLDYPDIKTEKGIRDRALLGVLVGSGLRREEVANLTWKDIQQRDGRWAFVDIVGKRGRKRTVPITPWLYRVLMDWKSVKTSGTEDEDRVFVSMPKGNKFGEPIAGDGIGHVVKYYAKKLGFAGLSAHDLRRTFAKLAYKGGADILQISLSLGHSSIETTKKYIGAEQDFDRAPCDFLGLGVE